MEGAAIFFLLIRNSVLKSYSLIVFLACMYIAHRYLINYSPFDLVYKITKFLPIHIFIYCLKEVQRVHKVHHGVSHTIHSHPHAFGLIIAIGVLKGKYAYNIIIQCQFQKHNYREF